MPTDRKGFVALGDRGIVQDLDTQADLAGARQWILRKQAGQYCDVLLRMPYQTLR